MALNEYHTTEKRNGRLTRTWKRRIMNYADVLFLGFRETWKIE